jgi:hypothetical protein
MVEVGGHRPEARVKITSNTSPIPLRSSAPVAARPASAERALRTTPRDSADLSGTGRFTVELRETARSEGRYGGIRADVVAGIKQEMAEGRFGGAADVEKAIDALLMEL